MSQVTGAPECRHRSASRDRLGAHYLAMAVSATPPTPMLATLGRPPVGEGWAFEMKWDGQRAVTEDRDGAVRLFSRNGNDITTAFPELTGPIADAVDGHDVIQDGEVVALDEKGRPSFSRLQRRMHVLRPTMQLRNAFPVTYYVFDVLALDGESTTGLPYPERRALLDGLALTGRRVQVPPFWTGVDGDRMLALAREHHLEGVVAKRADSTYRPGRRAPTWVKTPLRRNTEGVICGWVDGTGAARDGVGSLLLGAYDDIGNTGCTNVRNSASTLVWPILPKASNRSIVRADWPTAVRRRVGQVNVPAKCETRVATPREPLWPLPRHPTAPGPPCNHGEVGWSRSTGWRRS